MERADLIVTNGGDTLLQALALGKPCVAAPVARDQPSRLAMLPGGIRVARLDAADIAAACIALLQDSMALVRLRRAAVALGVRDHRDEARDALLKLLDSAPLTDGLEAVGSGGPVDYWATSPR
jgi:UDP:flavonoid glycosyltransferase YjiC (YdhE family)